MSIADVSEYHPRHGTSLNFCLAIENVVFAEAGEE
jgi:hypothetical protein